MSISTTHLVRLAAVGAALVLSACRNGTAAAPEASPAPAAAPSTTGVPVPFDAGTADPYIPLLPQGTVNAADSTTPGSKAEVPRGAFEIGHGVYFEGGQGLEVAGDDPLELADPTTGARVSMQVLNRLQSEDPNDLLQEYINTFDTDFASVAYMPSVVLEPGSLGAENVRGASVDYLTYADDGSVLEGSVRLLVRGDGLSMLMDFWAPAGEHWIDLSPAETESLLNSLVAAPSVGEPGPWAEARSVFPTSTHEVVRVDSACNCQVTLLPGYSLTDTVDGMVVLEAEGIELSLAHMDGVADLEDAQLRAAELAGALYDLRSMADFTVLAEADLTTYGGSWTGTANEAERTGDVWVMYDPSTQVALVAVAAYWPGYSADTGVLFTVRSFMWTQSTLY